MSNKKETEATIREACNSLVYLWKRQYNKSIKNKTSVPKAISIPQIAKKANLAPKTIYTNPEYKEIALTAISKTNIEMDDELGSVVLNKQNYTYIEVREMIKYIIDEQDNSRKILLKEVMQKSKEIEKLKEENERFNNIFMAQTEHIVKLESRVNQYLKLMKFRTSEGSGNI